MIHDSAGNYILPSNHSVLVLSDRCQFGFHGETWAYVTAADITCSGEPSDWSPECSASGDAPDGVSSWLVRELGLRC